MELRRDFTRSYLTLDGWKLFDASGSTGSPLAALVLDGSNEVTAASFASDAATTPVPSPTAWRLPQKPPGQSTPSTLAA